MAPPWQKPLRERAARIQEAFDCDVLQLPGNEIKTGKRREPELIKEEADKYQNAQKLAASNQLVRARCK